jgi:hypothetical protein
MAASAWAILVFSISSSIILFCGLLVTVGGLILDFELAPVSILA